MRWESPGAWDLHLFIKTIIHSHIFSLTYTQFFDYSNLLDGFAHFLVLINPWVQVLTPRLTSWWRTCIPASGFLLLLTLNMLLAAGLYFQYRQVSLPMGDESLYYVYHNYYDMDIICMIIILFSREKLHFLWDEHKKWLSCYIFCWYEWYTGCLFQ